MSHYHGGLLIHQVYTDVSKRMRVWIDAVSISGPSAGHVGRAFGIRCTARSTASGAH